MQRTSSILGSYSRVMWRRSVSWTGGLVQWTCLLRWRVSRVFREAFIYAPTITYGHEFRIMSKREKLWIQVTEISFFLGGRVRSSDIQRDLRGEPLLLLVERSWMKWFEALVRVTPLDVFSACVTETRSGWTHILSGLGTTWDPSGGTGNFSLLPLWPDFRRQVEGQWMDRLKGGFKLKCKAPLSDCLQCLAPRIIYRP